jgi:hypothetical protein
MATASRAASDVIADIGLSARGPDDFADFISGNTASALNSTPGSASAQASDGTTAR